MELKLGVHTYQSTYAYVKCSQTLLLISFVSCEITVASTVFKSTCTLESRQNIGMQ